MMDNWYRKWGNAMGLVGYWSGMFVKGGCMSPRAASAQRNGGEAGLRVGAVSGRQHLPREERCVSCARRETLGLGGDP